MSFLKVPLSRWCQTSVKATFSKPLLCFMWGYSIICFFTPFAFLCIISQSWNPLFTSCRKNPFFLKFNLTIVFFKNMSVCNDSLHIIFFTFMNKGRNMLPFWTAHTNCIFLTTKSALRFQGFNCWLILKLFILKLKFKLL